MICCRMARWGNGVIGWVCNDINHEHWTRDCTILRHCRYSGAQHFGTANEGVCQSCEAMWIVLLRAHDAAIRTYGVISCRLMPSSANLIRPVILRSSVSRGVYGGVAFTIVLRWLSALPPSSDAGSRNMMVFPFLCPRCANDADRQTESASLFYKERLSTLVDRISKAGT